MSIRTRIQLAEAVGQDNRWYCSQYFGRQIDDPEILFRYFVKSGGATDFARRYSLALATENRERCSQFYQREITDPEVLWNYFNEYARTNHHSHHKRHAHA